MSVAGEAFGFSWLSDWNREWLAAWKNPRNVAGLLWREAQKNLTCMSLLGQQQLALARGAQAVEFVAVPDGDAIRTGQQAAAVDGLARRGAGRDGGVAVVGVRRLAPWLVWWGAHAAALHLCPQATPWAATCGRRMCVGIRSVLGVFMRAMEQMSGSAQSDGVDESAL